MNGEKRRDNLKRFHSDLTMERSQPGGRKEERGGESL